jgi:transposase
MARASYLNDGFLVQDTWTSVYLRSNILSMGITLLDPRQQRGLALSKNAGIKRVAGNTWFVPSQSAGGGGYLVDTDNGSCSCSDHEIRGSLFICKHRWAVDFVINTPEAPPPEKLPARTTYRQDWPRYNAAQCAEKDRIQILLRALCDGVPNPRQVGPGRRRVALSDVIFAATMKIFVGLSGRRATSDIRLCAEKGFIDKALPYNTIFYYLERADITPILKELVRVSALPLAHLETSFAIDGTGFGSKVYKRWFDAKYGREMREARWVKLHAVCGVKTNILTAVEVTDATLNDSPLLPQLVQESSKGFTLAEVSADKAYLGRANLQAIEDVGAKPFIAFKVNSRGTGADVWRRAYHLFAFHREEWLERYHQRSNIESTFSMIKRKFGPAVRSRLPEAMANEVLLKCLAHNLSCLVHAIYELGVAPTFWGGATP